MGFRSSRKEFRKNFNTLLTFTLYIVPSHSSMVRSSSARAITSSFISFLSMPKFMLTVLNWMALLLQFRTFKLDSEVAVDARDYLIGHYSIDLTGFDVVIGYRADDSYFQYAESFVSNTLPLRSLNKALKLGKLGKQTVVISQKGFDRLHFVNAYPVSKSVYYPKFLDRDTKARDTYRKEIKKSKSYRDDIFVLDILREEMSNDDPRIQRILFE